VTDAAPISFTIRAYAKADRWGLEAMYADFEPKRAAQGLPPTGDEGRRRWLDRTLSRGRHQVAVVAGRILGHVMLIPMDGDAGSDGDGDGAGARPRAAELANFVHQSVRNRGIGTDLNRAAVAAARADGYRRVWLSVEPSNRAAILSYERAGFRRLPGSLWAPEIEMAVDFEVAAAADVDAGVAAV
jgi:ribosomal protein S18 acetylase RimI-like enzyme